MTFSLCDIIFAIAVIHRSIRGS